MVDEIIHKIQKSIEKGDEIAPFLFVGTPSSENNARMKEIGQKLLQAAGIDMQSFFLLEDTWEALKIAETKDFFQKIYEKPRFDFQIFCIENIGRMTVQSANACLKNLEEPGKGNIILLTNEGENGILDTILSRVQVIPLGGTAQNTYSPLYLDMIQEYIEHKDTKIIEYFFTEKLERTDYARFLETLVYYAQTNNRYWDFLEDVESDIKWLRTGSFNGKYIVDTYILRLI